MSDIDNALKVIMPLAKILNIREEEVRVALVDVQAAFAAENDYEFKPENKVELHSNSKHYIIGSTYIVEVDPLALKIIVSQQSGNQLFNQMHNLDMINAMNACFVGHHPDGKAYPISMLVSEGQIIHNAQPNGYWDGPLKGKGAATPTFVVYSNGVVRIRTTNDIRNLHSVRFAVAGVGVYPNVTKQGYEGYVPWSSVARSTARLGIGYRSSDNKVLLVYRPLTSVDRLHDTFENLNCDFGISLDSSGSANLIVDGEDIITTDRQMYAWITW